MRECYKAILAVESRDPTIIPGVIGALSKILSSECDKTVKTPSWSIHACNTLLVKVSPVFPRSEQMPLSHPVVRVEVEGSDPARLTDIITLITSGLEEQFAGQVYSRLSP